MNLEDAKAIMWLGLALLFAAGGLAAAYLLWRIARAVRTVELDLHRTVDEFVPIITKTGVSVDTVNQQLGKLDVMLDSAVDMTEAIDTSVRAVTHAVTEPVRAVSGAVSGAAEAARSFRDRLAGDDDSSDETAAERSARRRAATDSAATSTSTVPANDDFDAGHDPYGDEA